MKIEVTLIDKILIGLSIFLYLLGYFIGGWSIFFNLICLFFILTLLKKSYDKKKLATLYLIFFIFFIIFNILIKIGFIFNLLQNYLIKKTYNNKITSINTTSYSNDKENKINCPKIDRYFNIANENKTYEKTKLLPIDTRITFRNPESIAINSYKFTTVFSNKEETTIEFIGLKEYNNGEYMPMIYDVKGDQNSSTVITEPLFTKKKYSYSFLSLQSPNISISLNNKWYILSQSICNLGEICNQILYTIDKFNKNEEEIIVPEKYVLESIMGYYDNKIIFNLYDNSLIQYDPEKNNWVSFPNNIEYTKLNDPENIIKKYGCFYIPAYQGDIVFYKHKLFSTGYPDFKWVDVFYNKK